MENEQWVICPYCREQGNGAEAYLHPVEVRIYPVNGTTEVQVDHDGTQIRPTDAASVQHGVSVVLRFRCEAGHDWESDLTFNHGITVVTDTRLPDYDIETDEGPLVIWRD